MSSKKVYVMQRELWPYYDAADDEQTIKDALEYEGDDNYIIEMSETEWDEWSTTQQDWKRWQEWLKEKAGY